MLGFCKTQELKHCVKIVKLCPSLAVTNSPIPLNYGCLNLFCPCTLINLLLRFLVCEPLCLMLPLLETNQRIHKKLRCIRSRIYTVLPNFNTILFKDIQQYFFRMSGLSDLCHCSLVFICKFLTIIP